MKRAWMAGMSLLGVVVALGLALTGSVPLGPALAQLPSAPLPVTGSPLLSECSCARPTRLVDGGAASAVNCQCGAFQCVFGVADGGKSVHPPTLMCFR
jgi:hypothetical protein